MDIRFIDQIGCGLNVLNQPPILSLFQIDPRPNSKLTMENMAATIMSIFGRMWGEFMEARSFEPFMELYLERWIHSYVTRSLHTHILISLYFQSVHSDQLVTLDTVTPSIK